MALILRNNGIKAGTEILYRDALVSDGTLTCLDFSNFGCLRDENLESIFDLAFESKKNLGITDKIEFKVTGRGSVPSLNPKKGFSQVNIGSHSANSYDSGLNIYNVEKYLFEKQPNSLIIIWLDAQGNNGNEELASDIVFKSADTEKENIRLIGGITNIFSLRFGGMGFTNYSIPKNVVQIAIEFIDDSQPCKMYVNGKFNGLASANAYGFKKPSGELPISLGQKEPHKRGLLNFYRIIIEDLSKSGRKAIDVLEKDFNYVNGINEYDGIEKRPFNNI